MLTPKEARVLTVIREHLARAGIAPTRDELARETGFRSKSQVQGIIGRLVDKKHLERVPFCRRGLRLPEASRFAVTLPQDDHRALLAHSLVLGRPPEALIADAVAGYLTERGR